MSTIRTLLVCLAVLAAISETCCLGEPSFPDRLRTDSTGRMKRKGSQKPDRAGNFGAYNTTPKNDSSIHKVNVSSDGVSVKQPCHKVKLRDTTIDLGRQSRALLARYRCIEITLPEHTTWTWNESVQMNGDQKITINGDYSKRTATAVINMAHHCFISNRNSDLDKATTGSRAALKLSHLRIAFDVDTALQPGPQPACILPVTDREPPSLASWEDPLASSKEVFASTNTGVLR